MTLIINNYLVIGFKIDDANNEELLAPFPCSITVQRGSVPSYLN